MNRSGAYNLAPSSLIASSTGIISTGIASHWRVSPLSVSSLIDELGGDSIDESLADGTIRRVAIASLTFLYATNPVACVIPSPTANLDAPEGAISDGPRVSRLVLPAEPARIRLAFQLFVVVLYHT